MTQGDILMSAAFSVDKARAQWINDVDNAARQHPLLLGAFCREGGFCECGEEGGEDVEPGSAWLV